MSTYHFDIDVDGEAATETIEAGAQSAAIRQALLLISEILRDHGLSDQDAISVRLRVRDETGRWVWIGTAVGGHPDAAPDKAAAHGPPEAAYGAAPVTEPDATSAPSPRPPDQAGEIAPSATDTRLGRAADPAESKRQP